MAVIFQTTFSIALSWMKIYKLRSRFHWNLFPRVQLTIFQHWFQIMAWRRPGDKPLSEPMVVSLLMHICITRPQWVTGAHPLFQEPHLGELVWAHLGSQRWWPAVVIHGSQAGVKPASRSRSWVFWYGDHKISQVCKSSLNSLRFSDSYVCWRFGSRDPVFESCIQQRKTI